MVLRAYTLLILLFASVVQAGETSLLVGQGWLYARQQINLEFTNAVQLQKLDQIPVSSDPTSLMIYPRNSPMDLLEWHREPSDAVIAQLRTDGSGPRSFDCGYLVRGPSWYGSYQLIVRADPEHDEAPVSVDVDGRVTINNVSDGSWTNARVRLISAERAKDTGRDERGILMLDETSPLSDAWGKPASRENREFVYEFDRPVNIRAGEERAFTFVSAIRRSASRRYVLDSDEFALGGGDPGKSLRRIIAVPNDTQHGLGRDLPGGRAQIFLGSVRASLGEAAWLDRTPSGGEIRIELGRSDRVRGFRRSISREAGSPGEINEQFELVIHNDLESIARVEILEQPSVPQAWDVLRSSHPYELRNRRLLFRLDVPAGETTIIRYITRSHEMKI